MERSQSYSSFEANCANNMVNISSNIDNDNNNNNDDDSSNNKMSCSHSSGAQHLRKTRQMRQKQLQQLHRQQKHQQQQQHRLLEHSGSSDQLSNQRLDDIACALPMRKRRTLQRQNSAIDDADYAADLDEEDEDVDDGFEIDDIDLDDDDVEARLRHSHHSARTLKTTIAAEITPSQSVAISSASSTGTDSDQASTAPHTSAVSGGAEQELELSCSPSTRRQLFGQLKRDNSLHSDSSRYSSVDSLLESRKPDPEAILINLGFGPMGTDNILARIPKRFLKPSQVRGIDTCAFVKRLHLASSLADHSALGYRGLTGNPDVPPSSIVAKIMQRFEVNERKKSMGSIDVHCIR